MVLTNITTKLENQPIIRYNQQHINRNRKNQLLTISTVSGSHWLHNLTASFWSTSTFKLIITPLLGFYHLTEISHLFLTSRRRSKKNQPFPFSGFAGFQNRPFPVLGSPWLPQSSISPFGISSTFTTVSLPFWDFADFYIYLSPLLGSRRLSQLSLSPFGVSPAFTSISLPFWGLAGVAKLLQFKRRREPDQEFTQQTQEYSF